MLVLSRKASEGINFPELGIRINIVKATRGKCRIAIDAPTAFTVLRSEFPHRPSLDSTLDALDHLPREIRHDLRNEIHVVNLGVQIINSHLSAGDLEKAQEAAEFLQSQMKELTCHPAFWSRTSNDRKAADSQPASTTTDADSDNHSPAANSSQPRAVLVEDNDNERQLLATLLQRSGIIVDTVASAEAARNWLESHDQSSFLLTDMGLPGEDGASLVRHIRSNPRYSQLRVFGVSGSTCHESGLRESDVDGWFLKPLDVESLVKTIAADVGVAA